MVEKLQATEFLVVRRTNVAKGPRKVQIESGITSVEQRVTATVCCCMSNNNCVRSATRDVTLRAAFLRESWKSSNRILISYCLMGASDAQLHIDVADQFRVGVIVAGLSVTEVEVLPCQGQLNHERAP